jgi:hypothetical protein
MVAPRCSHSRRVEEEEETATETEESRRREGRELLGWQEMMQPKSVVAANCQGRRLVPECTWRAVAVQEPIPKYPAAGRAWMQGSVRRLQHKSRRDETRRLDLSRSCRLCLTAGSFGGGEVAVQSGDNGAFTAARLAS